MHAMRRMGEEEDMDARRRSPPATCSSSETLPAVVCHVTCRIACWAALPDQIDLTRVVASQPEPGSGSLPGHGQREESLGLGPPGSVSTGGPLDYHHQHSSRRLPSARIEFLVPFLQLVPFALGSICRLGLIAAIAFFESSLLPQRSQLKI